MLLLSGTRRGMVLGMSAPPVLFRAVRPPAHRAAMRLALAAALFLAGHGAAQASERSRASLLAPNRVALLPDMVTEYALSMAARQAELPLSLRPDAQRLVEPAFRKFRWRAEDGSIVQRVGDGRFRITSGDCVASMCTNLVCDVVRWPEMICEDGSQRRMSAPDLQTVVLDGRTYTRALPAPDPELPEEGPILPQP